MGQRTMCRMSDFQIHGWARPSPPHRAEHITQQGNSLLPPYRRKLHDVVTRSRQPIASSA
jgi:hypothetical protein